MWVLHFVCVCPDTVKVSKLQYTPDQLKRLIVLSGELGKRLDSLMSDGTRQQQQPHSKTSGDKCTKDLLRTFVREFSQDALFDYIPGRSHKELPGFVARRPLQSPYKLGKELRHFSSVMDSWRRRDQSGAASPRQANPPLT